MDQLLPSSGSTPSSKSPRKEAARLAAFTSKSRGEKKSRAASDSQESRKQEDAPSALMASACLMEKPTKSVIFPTQGEYSKIPAVDPFSRILLYDVSVGGIEVRALLDSGATHSFMRETWAEKHRIPTRKCDSTPVAVFNEQQVEVTRETRVKLRIGERSGACTFFLLAAAPYDIVLGVDVISPLEVTDGTSNGGSLFSSVRATSANESRIPGLVLR